MSKGSSVRRRIFRLQLSVNRKLTVTRWIGGATVGVVNLGYSRAKASEGAEKSCRKTKARRGRRSRGKKREGKSRSGTLDRPVPSKRLAKTRTRRRLRLEEWEEKRASSFLERLDEIREWEQSQKKHDAMRALRKSYCSVRVHVEELFGSSLCWSRFLYLSNVPVWRCNAQLSVSIIHVDWEDVLRDTNISETRPKAPPVKVVTPTLVNPLLSLTGKRVYYRNGKWEGGPPRAFGSARPDLAGPRKQTLPVNKTIEQDVAALRPPRNQVGVTQAKVCRWCGRRKGVVHGNMSCDATRNARGHQFVSP